MDKVPQDIDSLMARWLSGDLTDEEKQEFDAWTKMDPENAAEAKKLKAVWDATSHAELPVGESFESRWERLGVAISTEKKQRWLVFKIAACLLVIILGCASAVWVRNGEMTAITHNGEWKNVILPDGSSVTLNAGSSIKYNSRMWIFGRKVQLEGEAFFDVIRNGETFTVETHLSSTKVLGTSFNIRERNNSVSVSCLTGKVGVTLQTGRKDYIALDKGNHFRARNGNVVKSNFNTADASPIAWMKKKLRFDHTPLDEVFDEIIRFYNIRIDHSLSTAETFTGTFEGAAPEEIVKIVCLSSGLRYTMGPDNVITISK